MSLSSGEIDNENWEIRLLGKCYDFMVFLHILGCNIVKHTAGLFAKLVVFGLPVSQYLYFFILCLILA